MSFKHSHPDVICANLPLLSADNKASSFEYLSFRDLVLVSTVSPSVKGLVDQFIHHKWLRVLSRFVDSPAELCNLLRRTRSVVSGSTTLHFILDEPRSWCPSDCDLYVPFGTSEIILRYLHEQEGYVEAPRRCKRSEDYVEFNPPSRLNPSIHSVIHLYRSTGMKVDIIESYNASALLPIAYFWSTHVMNYASADTICVAYPSLTFNSRGCYSPIVHSAVDSALVKYEARGFKLTSFAGNAGTDIRLMYPSLLDDCDMNPNCPHIFRSFGDKWCLQVFFGETGLEKRSLDAYVPQWRYGGTECGVCAADTDREVRLMQQ